MGHRRPFRGRRAEACSTHTSEIRARATAHVTQRCSLIMARETKYYERRRRPFGAASATEPSDASGSAGALTAAAELSSRGALTAAAELSSSTHRLTTARLVASAAAICCAHSSAAAIQRHGRRIVDRQRHSSATSASRLLAPASRRAHSDTKGRQANSVAGARQPQRDCFRKATGRQVVRAGGQGGDPSAR